MTKSVAVAAEGPGIPTKRRPNLREVYKQPIPIRTFPLPSFYPSNPVSLLHLAYVWLKQVCIPPPQEPSILLQGQWNLDTRSIQITDPASMRILWEQGFWGKGNLSRSEPNWLKREQVRRGLLEGDVSEEFTISRREDRQRLKWERAKAEQKAIDRIKALELKAPVGPLELLALPNSLVELQALPKTGLAKMREALEAEKQHGGPPEKSEKQNVDQNLRTPMNTQPVEIESIHNREHLQLSREEAFFLVFAVGTLTVVDDSNRIIPTDELLALFRSWSYFPSRPLDKLSPSDPFLVHYVVYHHFRSIGWCPRPGVKFGVDWLLYLDGPVFNHGEFGLIVIPSFSNPKWNDYSPRDEHRPKSWNWFMGTVRVLSHVFKSLVMVYVDIPPPPEFDRILSNDGLVAALKQYRIREVMVRRWSSNRNR